MAQKVLVVDDEPEIVRLVEIRLKANQYQALSASDVKQLFGNIRTSLFLIS